ncbi:MAG TPA: carboxypeptidase-like regulatory domain-containing protein [Candidatus Angelobacter sp.]
MSGDDRVRHCQECKLNVYNLSAMSRREAEELIARREGRLCVRFYQRADGTVLTRDCPVGFRRLVRKVSRFAGTALSALMSVSFCAAQTSPNSGAQATIENDQNKTGILITVTDPQGAVVSGAQVTITKEGTKKRFVASTNADGNSQLSLASEGSYEIQIESPGFKPHRQKLSIAKDKVQQISVKLTVDPKGAVTVFIGEVVSPVVRPTDSNVAHTFEGDLLKAGSQH